MSGRFREGFRWYGGVICAAVLVALLTVTVASALDRAKTSERTRERENRTAAAQRDELEQLVRDLLDDGAFARAQNAEATAKIDALSAQLEAAKIRPVVSRSSTVTTAPRRGATTSTTSRPGPTTTTPQQPGPGPTTTAPPTTTCTVTVPGDGCVP